MKKKILILVGGSTKHLQPFLEVAEKNNSEIILASFSNITYLTKPNTRTKLAIMGKDLAEFDVIYLRLVGRSREDLSLVVNYAAKNNIQLVDRLYQNRVFTNLPIAKSLEIFLLNDAGLPVPSTFYGSIKAIRENALATFGSHFVLKMTTGKQGHDVWLPKSKKEFDQILDSIIEDKTIESKRYIVQEFIKSSQRTRVLVIGGKAIAAITRPTKWRKRFIENKGAVVPEGIKSRIDPIPEVDAKLALKAAATLGIDIAGVDILHHDVTGDPYVLEVNSAPRWNSIEKDTGLDIEDEILKYLSNL